ncbi:putative phenylacetaldehyde dehydrogenase [Xanthomonas oryzae pv. oryzae PXO99A]|uniref:Putative phenylacetaldehyde dehydrogenase n=1 Tax=Xanthomonas oryzae pv. oryzae (strain PXO99A) TaxID=360094 RepID=A0A0K0GI96_XANOP|nr:putative phenylacetaldehyde dehydrogenase [Xanthomonas oryzae pv. oryzae PXO99A]
MATTVHQYGVGRPAGLWQAKLSRLFRLCGHIAGGVSQPCWMFEAFR